MAKAVIFDLDGTLADSEPAHEHALLAAAESKGLTFTPEYFRDRCVGLGEAGCFRMLAAEQGLVMTDALLAELIAAKLERFIVAAGAGHIRPHAGAVELVHAARAAMPIGLCSGSSRASVDPMLTALALADAFATVVTSCDIDRPKPDPQGYRLAAGRLGVPPSDCCAIEDSPTGVTAALGAGMRVIAVEHSFSAGRFPAAHATVPTIAGITLDMLRAL